MDAGAVVKPANQLLGSRLIPQSGERQGPKRASRTGFSHGGQLPAPGRCTHVLHLGFGGLGRRWRWVWSCRRRRIGARCAELGGLWGWSIGECELAVTIDNDL